MLLKEALKWQQMTIAKKMKIDNNLHHHSLFLINSFMNRHPMTQMISMINILLYSQDLLLAIIKITYLIIMKKVFSHKVLNLWAQNIRPKISLKIK